MYNLLVESILFGIFTQCFKSLLSKSSASLSRKSIILSKHGKQQPHPLHMCIMRNDPRGRVLPACTVTICIPVLSLHTGKAVSRAWTRVDLWLPALPTASPSTTALGSWTPRHPPTAWRPIWWTAQQVTEAALCPESAAPHPQPFPSFPLRPAPVNVQRQQQWNHWVKRGEKSTLLCLETCSTYVTAVKSEGHITLYVNSFSACCFCNVWTYS